MIRSFTAIILMIAFFVQSFDQAVIVLDYYANRSSFAKNCENKMLPRMHCGGKCQMMKKLLEEQKKDQQFPERKSENKNEVSSSASFFAQLSKIEFTNSTKVESIFIPGTLAQPSFEIFHPPA